MNYITPLICSVSDLPVIQLLIEELYNMRSNLKKIVSSAAILSLFGISTSGVQAATVSPNPTFNVTVSLTSVCTVAAIPDLNFGTYTAFGSASIPAPTTTVQVTCTRGLPASPTLAFDFAYGVVAGLNYTVASAAPTLAPGTAATPVASGTNGTPDVYSISITGAMPSGQPGTNSAGIQTDVRTVTISY